ncbi:MAG: 16S rRNA (cytosine1402-N4)-methyltransferase [Parcubacteria group bacterium Gr01-1014_66]|nr:MAG: 16S rRNA (cytosine1402-N4)-methyltransferase [Parcubacteria group bacterium Gr01-1014_66]
MHKPVMLNEVLKYLDPQPGGKFIDTTINGGGHASAIAERIGKKGKLLGIDRDCALIKVLSAKYEIRDTRYELVCANFSDVTSVAREHGFTNVDGILFDLGFSSFHIEESGRGFSFQKDEMLDMRYDTGSGRPAREIINRFSDKELADILFKLGGERFARRIARRVVEERQRTRIETTTQLVEVIKRAVPAGYRHGRIHFATRTFQALRMFVNDELEHVAKGVADAISLLRHGGRVVVISFHSGEDRIVKELFRQEERNGTAYRITKKPVRTSKAEAEENPRSRSAKLRVLEKILK